METAKKFAKPLLVVLGLIIGVLAIVGISQTGSETSVLAAVPEANVTVSGGSSNASQGLFIGILVLVILSFLVMIFVNCVKSKEASSYQVNDKEHGGHKDVGKENAGFEGDAKKGDIKEPWMDNYIPYGNFPTGKGVEAEVNNVNEKTDAPKDSSDEKWKTNYVEYEEKEDEAEEKKEW